MIMLTWLRRFPVPPASEGEDRTNPELKGDQIAQEQLLLKLIIGQTVAVTFLILMIALTGLLMPESGLLSLLPLGAIAAAVGVVPYRLVRRHQFRLGASHFLIGTCVAITATVFMRGYRDVSATFYLWPILGAAMLLEARGGILVATVSAIFYLALVAAEQLGYHTPPLPYDPHGTGCCFSAAIPKGDWSAPCSPLTTLRNLP